MPVIDDLITYLDPLVSESATANPPTLVEGPMPELPNDCVALTTTPGEPAEWVMGAELSLPDLEVAHVQLMVRSTSMATATSRALAYHLLLNNLGKRTISGRTYFDVRSMDGEPYSAGQDVNLRWRRVVNYRVMKASG